MSQVIVTQDNLSNLRQRSREQEHKITTEQFLEKRRLASLSQMRPLAWLIGVAALPVVAFWGLMLMLLSFSLSFFVVILKALGAIGGSASRRS